MAGRTSTAASALKAKGAATPASAEWCLSTASRLWPAARRRPHLLRGARSSWQQAPTTGSSEPRAALSVWNGRAMSVYMRAVLADWHELPFEELTTFIAETSPFRIQGADGQGWEDFEALDQQGNTALAADLWTGARAREELDELEEFLEDLSGTADAREAVRAHVREASAVVGMQVLMSTYDESVAAANAIIDFLERRETVLTQIDTVGWYDGPELLLQEPD